MHARSKLPLLLFAVLSWPCTGETAVKAPVVDGLPPGAVSARTPSLPRSSFSSSCRRCSAPCPPVVAPPPPPSTASRSPSAGACVAPAPSPPLPPLSLSTSSSHQRRHRDHRDHHHHHHHLLLHLLQVRGQRRTSWRCSGESVAAAVYGCCYSYSRHDYCYLVWSARMMRMMMML